MDNFWVAAISHFSLDEAYSIADNLYEKFLSISVVSDSHDKFWRLEITHNSEIFSHDLCIDLSLKTFSCKKLPNIDWLAKSFENFKPFTIGRFFIFGSHTKPSIENKNKICLEIDAATAFGSGEHPTTSGCLLACSTFYSAFDHISAMDLGCGSGILSMALAKLGCRKVYAYDNDIEAVRVCKSNIEKNNVRHLIEVNINESVEFSYRKYDFIVSNILADPLLKLSEKLVSCLNENGILILSGFTTDQDIKQAYEFLGLKEICRYTIDKWVTLVLRKCRFSI